MNKAPGWGYTLFCVCFGGLSIPAYSLSLKYLSKEFEKDVRCDGKVALITGGNSGIGKETARELAKRGAVVYLLCRNIERCNAARDDIIESTKNNKVYSRECNLGSLESVKKFSDQFHNETKHLHLLINNAGVWSMTRLETEDGFEMHLGVNYLGHFYLTNLLLDLLKNSAPSRIVNVASHVKGEINKEDLNSDKKYNYVKAYNQSKLASVLFTLELAERLKYTGVTANAVNPGNSATSLHFRGNDLNGMFSRTFLKPIHDLVAKSPVAGAQTSLYAALDPDLEKVTGKYFLNCKEEVIDSNFIDPHTIKWLWAASEKLVKLQ